MRLKGIIQLCGYDMKCIEEALSYVEKHYTERVSAEQLSMEVGLSVKKLQAGMKRKTGLTLHDHILKVRMGYAKAMLTDTCIPLKVISKAMGFRTPSHFGEVFKGATSMAPNEYRYHSEE